MKKGSINPHLWKRRIAICENCKKEFTPTKEYKKRVQRFCSSVCYRNHWILNVRPKMKNNPGSKGELNPSWKGGSVGYHGIHKWVIREKGKPMICENCFSSHEKKYEWANKDHQYKRNLSDWMRMCTKCHRAYDNKNNYGK
jgi:hypothetical protein